ncbi:MAG: hypothetical protein CMK00_06335 [Planctomycetes bacterium]|nr:hypothetical protein [Planctomycetota bacterium]
MLALAVIRWTLVSALRSPSCWLLIVATASLLPVLAVTSPLGLAPPTSQSPGTPSPLAGCALLALIGSHAWCLSALRRLAPLLARAPGPRLAAEAAALCACFTLCCLPLLLLALALGGGGAPDNISTTGAFALVPALVLAHTHLMGPSLVLLRFPLPAPLPGALLLCIALLLPGLLPNAPVLRCLAIGPFLLDASAGITGPVGFPGLLATHLPLLALWAGVLLLLSPRLSDQR